MIKKFGANTIYRELHSWIRENKKPSKICEKCGKAKSIGQLDLANISGEYKRDVNDYKWLCRKCHMEDDGRIKTFMRKRFTTAVRDKKTGRFIG